MPIVARNIVKDLGVKSTRILHGLNFEIADGEFVSVSGRSGSGKSTLLYILSTLDLPSQGELFINDKSTSAMSVKEVHEFRARNVGFVFQFHYLLPELTALENVLLPARNLGLHAEKKEQAIELLTKFDMKDKVHNLSTQLSGGEQQRVAIARALIMDPRFIFADEPTGNLDTANAKNVIDILMRINKEKKTTLVMVTHEPDFAKLADREIYLVDGQILRAP